MWVKIRFSDVPMSRCLPYEPRISCHLCLPLTTNYLEQLGKSAQLLLGRYRYKYEVLHTIHSVLNTSVKVSGGARHYKRI